MSVTGVESRDRFDAWLNDCFGDRKYDMIGGVVVLQSLHDVRNKSGNKLFHESNHSRRICKICLVLVSVNRPQSLKQ